MAGLKKSVGKGSFKLYASFGFSPKESLPFLENFFLNPIRRGDKFLLFRYKKGEFCLSESLLSPMDVIILPLLQVFSLALQFYVWIIFVAVALNWLILFQIINTHQPLVRKIATFCFQVTEPLLAPLRRLVPFVGGVDLSSLILLFGVYFLQSMVGRLILRLV